MKVIGRTLSVLIISSTRRPGS